jgi:hypothetical protein
VLVGKKIVRGAKEVVLHSKNNLFAELEVVQRSMVLFYDVILEGRSVVSTQVTQLVFNTNLMSVAAAGSLLFCDN